MNPSVSIITPAFNEAANLPEFHRRLAAALPDENWEWIAVDDGSTDGTFAVISGLAKSDARVRGVRLLRNFGSHAATSCGLARARGNAAICLAADLQDPPEMAAELIARWRAGAQVVWAVHDGTLPGEGLAGRALSWLYHFTLQCLAGAHQTPPPDAMACLLDRALLAALAQCGETHLDIFTLVAWIGGRQASVTYRRQPRLAGHSGWTMKKKIGLLLDSMTAFSFAPLRAMTILGGLTALAGFAYAVVVVANALRGHPPAGWSSLMVVVLVVGGFQMLMLGVLGEYIGRALREARNRPRYLVQEMTNDTRLDA